MGTVTKPLTDRHAEERIPYRTARARLLLEHLDLPEATGVDTARWEHFQLDHLNDDARFRITRKSRQIAFSWILAAEAVADAIIDNQSSAFVSINEDEAQEKVRYANAVVRALRHLPAGTPRVVRDNQTMLEFSNGARIISHPAKPIRGKPRFNVGLDEFAHVPRDRDVYVGSLPVITKGGRVRIGSSVMGAAGYFWEIFTQSLQPYPRFVRRTVPWWHVHALCTNVASALKDAHHMTTAERVAVYGTETIQALFDSMAVEDFQQEFECLFVDDNAAWITWPEIRHAQQPGLAWVHAKAKGVDITALRLALAKLQGMVARGEIETPLFGGLDIGRTRNLTELVLVSHTSTAQQVVRANLSMEAMPFHEQRDTVVRVLKSLPIAGLWIDRNGIGRQLAEELESAYPGIATGVDFTNAAKTAWATTVKVAFQKHRVVIPVERNLAYQIHSIKRLISASKNLVFDTDKNEKHHADKFWALALAMNQVPDADNQRTATVYSYLKGRRQPERTPYVDLGR